MQIPPFELSDDTRHFLAYVPWRTALNGRRPEARMGHPAIPLKPYAYATRIKKGYEYLRQGDIIWIFTIPYYGQYGSFPSLNSMLVVADKIDREQEESQLHKVPEYFNTDGEQQSWRYLFIGDQRYSRYFPINNCLELLRPLLSKKAARNLDAAQKKGYGYLGMAFQHAKTLNPEQGRTFYEFQQSFRRQQTLFISYRHRQEPEVVDKLVTGLLEAGINCSLDLNREAAGIEQEAGDEMEKFFKVALLSAVEECDGLLALESEAYWQSFWTGLEYGAAQALAEQKPGFQFIEADLLSLASEQNRRQLIKEVRQSMNLWVQAEQKRS